MFWFRTLRTAYQASGYEHEGVFGLGVKPSIYVNQLDGFRVFDDASAR